MTHPLRPGEAAVGRHVAELGYPIGIAAVLVRRTARNDLVVQAEMFLLKPDVEIAPMPQRLHVLDERGKPIPASSGEFWISTETFDPYHAVCDVDLSRR